MKTFAILTTLLLWGISQPQQTTLGQQPPTSSDSVSLANPFYAKLSAGSRAIVDGKPFRIALTDLADRVEIPVILDRRVDPSSIVNVGSIGPTVFAGIQRVAQAQDCVVMPIAGVIIVGRPAWIDATSEAILSVASASESAESSRIDVQWSEATTPTEALRLIARASGKAEPADELPHDLWAAADWKSIAPNVAKTLVVSQFDSPAAAANSPPSEKRFALRYRLDANRTPVIAAIRSIDRQSNVRRAGQEIRAMETEVTATAAAHRAGIEAFLISQSAKQAANVDLDNANLTLKLQYTPASQVFTKLAGAAGRACQIEASAEAACGKLITMSMEQASLRQLVAEVALQAGVHVRWSDAVLVVSAP
ncbi:hypothetical protein Pla52o_47030 [Novipirellula galeiformis]|uniref:Uncharacterized protein n=1 Tax=Novipirellula galeiformis TaxID=2528004 RepID=A0A5C6C7Q6_9BACT|nr:hypothetical protein [Novipirellula galeiformis]TWU20188.1 hypothetical protein Pla52o_47030 [Novipirellula galeiformis]